MYAWGNTRHGKLGVSSPTTVENLLVPTALEIVKGKKVMQAACGSNFSILLAMMDRIDDKDEGSLINLKDVLIRSAEKAKPKIARKRGTLSSHRIASSARCWTRVELTARSCVCSLVCLLARRQQMMETIHRTFASRCICSRSSSFIDHCGACTAASSCGAFVEVTTSAAVRARVRHIARSSLYVRCVLIPCNKQVAAFLRTPSAKTS